jgi:tetratricopeptide (TPR) repeat protein
MKKFWVFTPVLLLLATLCQPAKAWDGKPFVGGVAVVGFGNPLTDTLDFSATERQLFQDCTDGRLHQFALLDAALVASGVNDPTAMNHYRQQFFTTRDEVARSTRGVENSLQRLEVIHRILHERLLRGGYNASATNLAATLQTGVYNCASATVLFVALAAEFHIRAAAIELPGHVRARAYCDDQQYEIEVTCPVWKEAVRCTAKSSNESDNEQSARAALDGREISPCGLIAMIYYNRGIDAFNDCRYADAVAANRKALLLDPSNLLARENLLAAVNNWALALCDASHFAEAEQLLAEGRQFDPQHAAFVHNAIHVQQAWAQAQSTTAAQKTGPALPSL